MQLINSVMRVEVMRFLFIHSVFISIGTFEHIYCIVVIRLSVAFIILVIQFLLRKENKYQAVERKEKWLNRVNIAVAVPLQNDFPFIKGVIRCFMRDTRKRCALSYIWIFNAFAYHMECSLAVRSCLPFIYYVFIYSFIFTALLGCLGTH